MGSHLQERGWVFCFVVVDRVFVIGGKESSHLEGILLDGQVLMEVDRACWHERLVGPAFGQGHDIVLFC